MARLSKSITEEDILAARQRAAEHVREAFAPLTQADIEELLEGDIWAERNGLAPLGYLADMFGAP